MSGRSIPILSLGTYYTPGAPSATDDAQEMRGLVYLSKNNRPHYSVTDMFHPNHPRGQRLRLWQPQQAWQFVADVLSDGGLWREMFTYLKKRIDRPVALVPIPASCTTAATIDERWGARSLANALAAKGLGRVVLACVQSTATPPKRGGGATVRSLRANLCWHDPSFREDERVVYVDDVLTWGKHIAAVDGFMGAPEKALGLCVACTDSNRMTSAMAPRIRKLHYLGMGDDHPSISDAI